MGAGNMEWAGRLGGGTGGRYVNFSTNQASTMCIQLPAAHATPCDGPSDGVVDRWTIILQKRCSSACLLTMLHVLTDLLGVEEEMKAGQ